MGWSTTPPSRAWVGIPWTYDPGHTWETGPHAYALVDLGGGLPTSPNAMAIDADTGLVTWTPGAQQVKTWEFGIGINRKDDLGQVIAPQDVQVASVVAAVPDTPAGRRFRLFDMMPAINRSLDENNDGDLEKFLDGLQVPLDDLMADADHFPRVIDADGSDAQYVDLLLEELGNPFTFPMSLQRKRSLVQSLPVMWQKLGTAPGIVDTIRFFLGITVTVDDGKTSWILGESLLGADTVLGNSTTVGGLTFKVISPVALTQEQRDQITAICEFMKPAHTIFAGIEEP